MGCSYVQLTLQLIYFRPKYVHCVVVGFVLSCREEEGYLYHGLTMRHHNQLLGSLLYVQDPQLEISRQIIQCD